MFASIQSDNLLIFPFRLAASKSNWMKASISSLEPLRISAQMLWDLPHVVELRQRFMVVIRGWKLRGNQEVGGSIFRRE